MAVKKVTTKKTTAAKPAATVETAVTAPVQTEKIVKAEEAVKVEEKAAPAAKKEKAEVKEAAPAVKKAEVKEAAPKKAAPKKATTTAKKTVKTNLFVQAGGKEVSMEEAIARVKDAWKATGHKVGDLKDITVYVKPEESSIYYVVNGDVTGRVEF